jgi:hypothetical protein
MIRGVSAPLVARYWVGACLLLTLYTLAAALLLTHRDFTDEGPLSRDQPELSSPLPGGVSLQAVRDECFPKPETVSKVVGGEVDGRLYYACYLISGKYGVSVTADVLDLHGERVGDAGVIKRGGAWPWVGAINSSRDFVINGLLAAGVMILLWAWHRLRRERAGSSPPKSQGWRTGGLVALGIALAGLGLWGWATLMMVLLHPDSWGLTVVALLAASLAYGVLVGRVVVGRHTLLSWPRLGSRLRDLSLGLAGCIALFPALMLAMVIASGLGGLPVTPTLWHGLVLLCTAAAVLAAVGVWYRWRARRDASAILAPSAVAMITTGMAVGALTLFALTYFAFDF